MLERKYLLDQFGRKHDYLRISLTERCNLRCFYCMPEEGIPLREKAEFMTAEETVEIAKVFISLGVNKIRLTGGEPLIKKNAKLILSELGKLPVELSLTTNGVIVDRFIDAMKNAGVKSINISLDSLKEERFNAISRRNYFHTIKNNIDLLIAEGFDVKINVVLIKGTNDDEILDFINWTRTTPINIRFIEFMPFDGNNWDWNKKISFDEIIENVTTEFGTTDIIKIEDKPNDTSRNFRIRNAVGTFGIISTVTNPFCDTCNRIRLTADGKIKNCLFSGDESDLLTALRAGEDLEAIIRKALYAKKKERAGLESFENDAVLLHKNRSMTTIGG